MRYRSHHNNHGLTTTKRGHRPGQVERMAKRLFGRRIEKIGNKLFIKGKKDGHILVKRSDR